MKVRLEITTDLQKKIKYLCNDNVSREWSGILIFKETEENSLKAFDLIPMDIGSGAYTSYDFVTGNSSALVSYMNANEKFIDEGWRIGLIHSHHNMDVFFSGTDDAELNDNSKYHKYYLSLIVNNRGDFKAKIGYNTNLEIGNESFYRTLHFDVEVVLEGVSLEISDRTFIDQYNKIKSVYENNKINSFVNVPFNSTKPSRISAFDSFLTGSKSNDIEEDDYDIMETHYNVLEQNFIPKSFSGELDSGYLDNMFKNTVLNSSNKISYYLSKLSLYLGGLSEESEEYIEEIAYKSSLSEEEYMVLVNSFHNKISNKAYGRSE